MWQAGREEEESEKEKEEGWKGGKKGGKKKEQKDAGIIQSITDTVVSMSLHNELLVCLTIIGLVLRAPEQHLREQKSFVFIMLEQKSFYTFTDPRSTTISHQDISPRINIFIVYSDL